MTARTAPATPRAALALSVALALAPLAVPPVAAQDEGGNGAGSGEALPEGVLAIVNGRAIPTIALENIVRQIEAQGAAGQDGGPPDRERILGELIDLEILAQEAEKLELDEQPEIAAALQLQYVRTMANAYLAETGDAMEIGEAELRDEYERQTAGLASEEYRASHVLLESEADAQAVIDALADGAEFEALAKERSVDPSGANGGDLGWFQADAMVPAFAEAMVALEVGETSDAPVRSEFGWHVIRLDEERGAALPDFEAVRPGLENLVLRDRLAAKVEALRESADVRR